MIKNTHKSTPEHVLSAYRDNAAVMEGNVAGRFYPAASTKEYGYNVEEINILMKVKPITIQRRYPRSLVLQLARAVKSETKVQPVVVVNLKLV